MANKDLFEQAIADAKKLKAISMANAKQVIEEAFAPKIQEMFRLKLSEMENLEEDENQMVDAAAEISDAETDDVNEATLEEILAELELEEGEGHGYTGPMSDEKEDSPLSTSRKDTAYGAGSKDIPGTQGGKPYMEAEEEEESEEEEVETEETEEMPEESATGDEKVTKLTVDMLTDIIQNAISMAMGNQEGASDEEGDLEGADEVPGGGVADEESINIGETISLDEILAELEEAQEPTLEEKKMEEAEDEHKEKLEEAVKTINYLKSQLSEINLLNAKLLYVNKIFKSKSLTESQKVTVVTAFDRAVTTKEAKNIYETLVDSLTPAQTPKKAAIKESLGFASKPIGSAPAKPIVEADAYVYRMQQLAGIKKPNI